MRNLTLIALALAAVVLVLSGCSQIAYWDSGAYWSRPGATLPTLVSESEDCYRAAIGLEAPAALAVTDGTPRLLPRTEPPPAVWRRAPREAAFEHFEEQLRFERCMRTLGWTPARAGAPAL